eukprot:TRINITY_DN24372_c0_g1_i1.p1 TRINITY_DN24372_c0_g1~~TRINITY_DN24372_c0_g1_i1.p1  ORF type:complete len:657 (+),score=167.27 TRINITY_DN24372_c0_g1_i1:56-2026(+)
MPDARWGLQLRWWCCVGLSVIIGGLVAAAVGPDADTPAPRSSAAPRTTPPRWTRANRDGTKQVGEGNECRRCESASSPPPPDPSYPPPPPSQFVLSNTRDIVFDHVTVAEGIAAWNDRDYRLNDVGPELDGSVLFRGPHKEIPRGTVIHVCNNGTDAAQLLLSVEVGAGRDGGWARLQHADAGWVPKKMRVVWSGVQTGRQSFARAMKVGECVALPPTGTQETVSTLIAASPSAKQASLDKAGVDPSGDDKVVVVFTTGCNGYQNWQSELLAHSHAAVRQRGRLVRVVSGCNDPSDKGGFRRSAGRVGVSRSTNPRLEIFHARSVAGSASFQWLNKPNGFLQWVEQAQLDDDAVVVVLDPDQVFMEPLLLLRRDENVIATRKRKRDWPLRAMPRRGRPVAQQYGLGDTWITKFSRKSICGEDSPCTRVSSKSAWDHYAVGPPLILTAPDLPPLARKWVEFMGPVLKVSKGDIITDMWAYCMAAAHLEMPHLLLDHFMVSGPETSDARQGEGWQWVDRWPHNMSCRNPTVPPGKLPPTFIHFCQPYTATDANGEEWYWHKRAVPEDILSCGVPLLKRPPDNLWRVQKDRLGRRTAFMLCWLHAKMDAMLVDYKTKFCSSDWPKQRTLRILPRGIRPRCRKGQLCWPEAAVEAEEEPI